MVKCAKQNNPFYMLLFYHYINTVSGTCTVSSLVVTKSPVILFMQVHFFKYSSISQCLSHLQPPKLGF